MGENAAASFPCGTALGATWDPDLVSEVGAAIGREALSKQARVLLAPTLNIHRHPLAGRNFECYSEDPYLVSRIGVGFVQGVQSQGVAATAKHFVCNDSEFERMSISSEVDERTLNEIYLPPFEAAVKEGQVWAAMTAYNRINGTYASEHTELIALLKETWGFDGLLMSDWWGTYSTDSAEAGLDLEMPGRARFFGRRLREALDAGRVSHEVFDDKVRRILRLEIRTGTLDGTGEGDEQSNMRDDDRALIRRAAAEAAVLLKNDGGLLPFAPKAGAVVALIGPNADLICMQGGGSSAVEPHRVTSFAAALREQLGPGIEVVHEAGCDIAGAPRCWGAWRRAKRDGRGGRVLRQPDFAGEPVCARCCRGWSCAGLQIPRLWRASSRCGHEGRSPRNAPGRTGSRSRVRGSAGCTSTAPWRWITGPSRRPGRRSTGRGAPRKARSWPSGPGRGTGLCSSTSLPAAGGSRRSRWAAGCRLSPTR